MRGLVIAAVTVGFGVGSGSIGAGGASAEIVISINKSTQRMAVLVDGKEQHVWQVSTGLGGGPPSGSYRPERMERKWYSHKYGMSPMPHSIFFHEGYAIHGTVYVSRLGRRASHGCVRLHPSNAATLFSLVQGRGVGQTTIVISNSDDAARSAVAPKVEAAATTGISPVPAAAPANSDPTAKE